MKNVVILIFSLADATRLILDRLKEEITCCKSGMFDVKRTCNKNIGTSLFLTVTNDRNNRAIFLHEFKITELTSEVAGNFLLFHPNHFFLAEKRYSYQANKSEFHS